MAVAVFICDFGIEDQFLGVIIQRFYSVIGFTTVDPLAVNEFPDLCDELAGSFESSFFASYVSEINLLCPYEVFVDET